MTDERLDVFREMNERPQRASWEERLGVIQEQFPSTTNLNWKNAFDRDLDLFARIMRDILKVDQAVPGRPGPRPALDYDRGVKTLTQLMGQDYSTLVFHEAFSALIGQRSIRHVAHMTGIPRSQIHRLLKQEVEPDVDEMVAVAKAFGKDPSFFAEYRAGYVTAHINARLMDCPEASIGFYRRMQDAEEE